VKALAVPAGGSGSDGGAEAAQVEAARKAGATWIEIGACYGLTKQGAQQKFRAVRNRAKAAEEVQ
jgi:hypothetical protein